MKTTITLLICSGILISANTNAQQTQIVSANGDTLWAGIPNPMGVLVPGINPERIQLRCENGAVEGANGQYFYIPSQPGFGKLTVIVKNAKGDSVLNSQGYYCKLPAPDVIYFPGSVGSLTTTDASNFQRPTVTKEGTIEKFTLSIVRNKLLLSRKEFYGIAGGQQATIDETTKKNLSQLLNNDQIKLTDVNVNMGPETGMLLAKSGNFIISDPSEATINHKLIPCSGGDGALAFKALDGTNKKMNITVTLNGITSVYQGFMPEDGLEKTAETLLPVDKNAIKSDAFLSLNASSITMFCVLNAGSNGKKQNDNWVAPCIPYSDKNGQIIAYAPLFWVNASDAKRQLKFVNKDLLAEIK